MNGTAYISGPITSNKSHVDDFIQAKTWLLYFDIFPLDPHDISEYNPEKTWRDYMADDLHYLIKYADYIYLLHGWWHSKGAWLELIVALFCGIKILNGKLPKDNR